LIDMKAEPIEEITKRFHAIKVAATDIRHRNAREARVGEGASHEQTQALVEGLE
jgi:hypothetical protein